MIQLLLKENVGTDHRIECPTCRAATNSRPCVNFTLKGIIKDWVKSKDNEYDFAEWKGDEGYRVIKSFFMSLPEENGFRLH